MVPFEVRNLNNLNPGLFYFSGVKETIEKQTKDEEKKKLQDQMNELDELMKMLSNYTSPGSTVSTFTDFQKKVVNHTHLSLKYFRLVTDMCHGYATNLSLSCH